MTPTERYVCPFCGDYIEACECTPKEQCVCAAIQMPDGYVIRGHRHDDCYLVLLGLRKEDDLSQPRYGKAEGHQAIQGFMTTRGRFVDRAEGARLEIEAGREHFIGSCLTSEDLY